MCQRSGHLSPEGIASHLHPHGHLDASLVPGRRQESGAFWNPCLPIFAFSEQVHLQLAMVMPSWSFIELPVNVQGNG
jgi:hypothetical protein